MMFIIDFKLSPYGLYSNLFCAGAFDTLACGNCTDIVLKTLLELNTKEKKLPTAKETKQ